MEVASHFPTLTDLDLACARSLRRAAGRRAAAARRTARSRVALRTLALATAVCSAFLAWPAPVEPMAANARRDARPSTPSPAELAAAACGIPQRFAAAFGAAAAETGLPLPLLSAVAWEESRMNPDAVSSAGAQGLLQVMPETAEVVAVTEDGPSANVLAGARYLLWLIDRFDGNLELALAAYNAGPTAVDRAGGAPTIETLRYAKNVERRAAALSGCA